MKFLLLNQFYPPDPAPTGWYLHGLARELVRRGHSVKVLCSRGSYDGAQAFPRRDFLDGVEVSRVRATSFGRRGFLGKMADYGSFYASLAAALFCDRSKPDLILSLTTPPYIGLLGKFAAARFGCKHAHWIMDLYPDVMVAHRKSGHDGLPFRMLRNLTRFQLRGADAVLSLGPGMSKRVAAYIKNDHSPSSVAWVPLWSDPDASSADETRGKFLRARRGWQANDVIFLYSGNMGLGHRFGEFLEASRRLGETGPRWVFSGGGKRRSEIEAFARAHPKARLEMSEYVPQNQLRAHLCAGDVHLASLDSAWQCLMVPSKLQASFAVARPVIFVGGHHCETAAWIGESGGGWIVDQDDAEGLLSAVSQALNPEERQRRGQAALNFARKHFNMLENCGSIARLLETGVLPSSSHVPASVESLKYV